MPFIALQEGEHVVPANVSDGATIDCIGCDDTLGVRSSHERNGTFVARHFWHPDGNDGCEGAPGGESYIHQKLKSICFSKANQQWPQANVQYEGVVGDRRADVLIRLPELDERLGHGIAIEVQHKNESKDIEAVTTDYRDAGYTALWLNEEHFCGKDVDLDAGDWRIWWPAQVPSSDEWTGFSDVIEWLEWVQNNADVNVEMSIPLPGFTKLTERKIRQAWERGREEGGHGWEQVFDLPAGYGTYISVYDTPGDNPPNHCIALRKPTKPYNDNIFAPFDLSIENRNILLQFKNDFNGLLESEDNHANRWESEIFVSLESKTQTETVLEVVRAPDGDLLLKLGKMNDTDMQKKTARIVPGVLAEVVLSLADFCVESSPPTNTQKLTHYRTNDDA